MPESMMASMPQSMMASVTACTTDTPLERGPNVTAPSSSTAEQEPSNSTQSLPPTVEPENTESPESVSPADEHENSKNPETAPPGQGQDPVNPGPSTERPTPPDGTLCIICGRPDVSSCSRCREVWYCGKACQSYDWKVHKHLCRESPYPAKDPRRETIRAIFFPVDGQKPVFVNVPCVTKKLFGSNAVVQKVEREKYLTDMCYMHDAFNYSDVTNSPLGYEITLWMKVPNIFIGGMLVPNQALQEVIGVTPEKWTGPILAMKAMRRSTVMRAEEDVVYMDITIEDLRHVVNYFKTHGAGCQKYMMSIQDIQRKIARLTEKGSKDSKGDKKNKESTIDGVPFPHRVTKPTHGVVIHCAGNVNEDYSKFYDEFVQPTDHLTTHLGGSAISPVSKLIGLPIRIHKIIPGCIVACSRAPSIALNQHLNNHTAASLFINVDTGTVPIFWQSNVGSVFCAREDGRKLNSCHIEAFAEFCQHKLGSLYEEWEDSGRKQVVGTRKIDMLLTRDAFEKFFKEYRLKVASRAYRNKECRFPWDQWVSPYDVTQS